MSVGSLGGDVGASVRAVAKAGRFDLERAQRTFKDVGVLIFDHPTRGRELGIALSADAIDTDRKVMVGEHWHAGLGLASSKEDWGGSPGSPSSPLVSDLRHHRAEQFVNGMIETLLVPATGVERNGEDLRVLR